MSFCIPITRHGTGTKPSIDPEYPKAVHANGLCCCITEPPTCDHLPWVLQVFPVLIRQVKILPVFFAVGTQFLFFLVTHPVGALFSGYS